MARSTRSRLGALSKKALKAKATAAARKSSVSKKRRTLPIKNKYRAKDTGLPTPPSASPSSQAADSDSGIDIRTSQPVMEIEEERSRSGTPASKAKSMHPEPKLKFVPGTLVIKMPPSRSSDLDMIMDDIPGPNDGYYLPKRIQNIFQVPMYEFDKSDFAIAFDAVKTQLQRHCRKYFTWTKESVDGSVPTMLDLEDDNPETLRYLRVVADGSQYGWEKLIEAPNQRENAVYAMLSRALTTYMFDQEFFGADSETNKKLLDMCREYIDYDGFVRSQCRARIIREYIGDYETYPDSMSAAKDRLCQTSLTGINFSPIIAELAASLYGLTSPLLNPDHRINKAAMNSLTAVLEIAFLTHVAIRLYGETGAVFRYEYPAKFSAFDKKSMNCVNQLRMDTEPSTDATLSHPLLKTNPITTVSCFPAVYATIPIGPSPTLMTFTDPQVLKSYTQSQLPRPNPNIVIYPICPADVVLEHRPLNHRARTHSKSKTTSLKPLLNRQRQPKKTAVGRRGRQWRKWRSRLVAGGIVTVLGFEALRNKKLVGMVAGQVGREVLGLVERLGVMEEVRGVLGGGVRYVVEGGRKLKEWKGKMGDVVRDVDDDSELWE